MIDDQLKTTLKNIHDSLKWSWQLVMGLSLISVTSTYAEFLSNGGNRIEQHFMLFLFLLTFFRFLIGNSRYLDERYVEFIYELEDLNEDQRRKYIQERTRKLSGVRRLFDYIMLTVTGILFILLGKSLISSDAFIQFYLILLGANVVFLSVSVLWNTYIEVRTEQSGEKVSMFFVFNAYRYEKFPVIWIVNNLLCLLMFFLLHSNIAAEYEFTLFTAIFITNSLVDLYFAWEMYFPKLNITFSEKP